MYPVPRTGVYSFECHASRTKNNGLETVSNFQSLSRGPKAVLVGTVTRWPAHWLLTLIEDCNRVCACCPMASTESRHSGLTLSAQPQPHLHVLSQRPSLLMDILKSIREYISTWNGAGESNWSVFSPLES